MLKEDVYYLIRLEKLYKDLGLNVHTIEEDSSAPSCVFVSDCEEFEIDWHRDDHTGMFFYFYPLYKAADSEDNLKFLVHINSIVIKKEDRGTGLATKMIDGMIKVFGKDLGFIELSDFSKGFWNKFSQKYPDIEWKIESCE